MKNFSTLTNLIDFIGNNYNNPKAFNFYQNQQWTNISTADFVQNVQSLTLGFSNLGIQKNDGFAILAKPSPIWLMIDSAVIALGAISVPIFPDIAPQNLLFEIENANIKFVFCDCLENLQILQNCTQNDKIRFKKIIIYGFDFEGENIIHFDDLLKIGSFQRQI